MFDSPIGQEAFFGFVFLALSEVCDGTHLRRV